MGGRYDNKNRSKRTTRETQPVGMEEGNDTEYPKHGPHSCGKRPGGMCARFPCAFWQEYDEDETVLLGGEKNIVVKGRELCGKEDLEIEGRYGYRHVRCPFASRTPCQCGLKSLHLDSLIVAVDGACPGNGSDRAVKSACGVYFGPDAADNMAFRVPDEDGYAHTNQRAELKAAIAAIIKSKRFVTHGGQWECDGCPKPCTVKHIVIKSDSAYLVNGITEHIRKWDRNGWRTANNTEVKNRDLWEELLAVCMIMDENDVAVDFWHVPRGENKEADELANLGLRKPLR